MATPKASTIENGVEICNTCVRPADAPYRYLLNGRTRGCISRCHDAHVGHNAYPDWMSKTRLVLPKWITDARRAMKAKGMVTC